MKPSSRRRAAAPAAAILIAALALALPARPARALYADDFTRGLKLWKAELELPGRIEARGGVLTIDVPGGCTLWFLPELTAPVTIEYDATPIQAGGPNDRVSDLNTFWMATDARSPADLFATHRSGKFADYNQLRAYYVGQGGNSNTTTRFRRYIGDAELRPLLPEHDLRSPDVLLEPNTPVRVRLVAGGNHVQYWANGKLLFDVRDPSPYTRGRFAFRTVDSHFEIRHFRVYR